jgi:hypothetical protein
MYFSWGRLIGQQFPNKQAYRVLRSLSRIPWLQGIPNKENFSIFTSVSTIFPQVEPFHIGWESRFLEGEGGVKCRVLKQDMLCLFSTQDCGPDAFPSFSKPFSQLQYTWLAANILCTGFHKLAVYFYFRNSVLYYESISVCSKATTIVSGWWDYRWFFILFFLLICIVWLCCGEYILPVNGYIIKAVLNKIQFHYNVK